MAVRWTEADLIKHQQNQEKAKQDLLNQSKVGLDRFIKPESIQQEKDIKLEWKDYWVDYGLPVLGEWTVEGNCPSLKNNKDVEYYNGKPYAGKSDRVKSYIKAHATEWKAVGMQIREKIETLKLEYPVFLGFFFVRQFQREFDFVNVKQLPLDLMQTKISKGVILWKGLPDDSASYVVTLDMGRKKDPDNPSTTVYLLDKKITLI